MIGYDVEAFAFRGDTLCPASSRMGGSKDSPETDGEYNYHPDNIMAEFSCSRPIEVAQLREHLLSGVDKVAHMFGDGYSLKFLGSVDATSLGNHPDMGQLGCLPDMVYDEERALTDGDLGTFRGAGFHLHFDVLPESMSSSQAARVCDAIIGTLSVALGEDQGDRRRTYGRAGAHRPKPYGIEYRMLSGDFVNILNDNWEQVRKAVALIAEVLGNPHGNVEMMITCLNPQHDLAGWINNQDRESCARFYEEHILPAAEQMK